MTVQAPRIMRTDTGYRLGDLEATGLTPRESQVALLRANGASVKECAQILCCSTSNIRQITDSLFYKLRANSAPELICKLIQSRRLQFVNLALAAAIFIGLSLLDNNHLNRAQRSRISSHLRIRARNNREDSLC